MDVNSLANRIYLITGVMASGKSTVAQLLAERLPRAVHLRGDVFRRMIVSGREEMCQDAGEEAFRQLRLRYRITADAARRYYEAGFDVVVQDNYYGPMLEAMTNLLEGLPVQVVVLCPSVEAVAERERTRGKKGYGGYDVAPLYESFMRETPRLGLWLDTTRMTPEETVNRIFNDIIGGQP